MIVIIILKTYFKVFVIVEKYYTNRLLTRNVFIIKIIVSIKMKYFEMYYYLKQ